MSVFSTERPISATELKALQEQKAAEYKANRQLMEAQRLLEEQEAKAQEEMAKQDAEQKKKEEQEQALEAATQRYNVERANKAYVAAVGSLPKIARETLTKHVLCNIMMESLWVDDSVKSSPEFMPQTVELFEQVIDKCDKATNTSLLANMENTRLLSYINDVITESADAICERILTEAKETKPLTIEFTPNEEEMEIVDKKIADADPKTISKVVKDKVLNIIKEEKEDGKVKAELFQELDEAESEEEDSDNVEESLMGIPLDQVMKAIDIKGEGVSEFEHMINKAVTMATLADKECIAGNKDKAIGCYRQTANYVGQAAVLYPYEDSDAKNAATNKLMHIMNSRGFDIRPGTGKAVRYEKPPRVVRAGFHGVAPAVTEYCNNMAKALSKDNVITETVGQLRNRLSRKSANQVLQSSVGATLFETQLIKNTINVKAAVTESGVSMLDSEVQNAALLQTIVEYTMFETLNTMQVYKFDRNAIAKLKMV